MFKVILLLSSLSIVFYAVAGTFYFQSQRLLKEGGTTSGTVLRLEASGKGASYPIVRFRPDNGEAIEGRGKVGSSPPEFKTGDTVPILYDKGDPKNWTINSWLNLYFLPVLFFAFGSGLTIASFITLIVDVKRKRKTGSIQ
jgi:hypothetical protein